MDGSLPCMLQVYCLLDVPVNHPRQKDSLSLCVCFCLTVVRACFLKAEEVSLPAKAPLCLEAGCSCRWSQGTMLVGWFAALHVCFCAASASICSLAASVYIDFCQAVELACFLNPEKASPAGRGSILCGHRLPPPLDPRRHAFVAAVLTTAAVVSMRLNAVEVSVQIPRALLVFFVKLAGHSSFDSRCRPWFVASPRYACFVLRTNLFYLTIHSPRFNGDIVVA